jgi:parallel beta-helix repeat protein
VQLLACKGAVVDGNWIDGVGDTTISGAANQGIRVAQKQSGSSDNNVITGNTVRQPGGYGIYLVGANGNIVTANQVSNPGTVASKRQAIRLDVSSGVPATNNVITSNRCYDDQTAASPSGGASTNTSITIVAACDTNLVTVNHLSGYVTSGISDSGTGNVTTGNLGG